MPCSRCCGYDQKAASPGQGPLCQMAACPGAHGRRARCGGRHQAGVHAVQGRGQIRPFSFRTEAAALRRPNRSFRAFPGGNRVRQVLPSRFSGRIVSLSAATSVAIMAEAPIVGSASRKSGGASGAGAGGRARAVTACWPAGAADRPRRKERPPAGQDNPGCFAPGPCCRAPKRPRTRPRRPGRG